MILYFCAAIIKFHTNNIHHANQQTEGDGGAQHAEFGPLSSFKNLLESTQETIGHHGGINQVLVLMPNSTCQMTSQGIFH